MTSEQRRLIRDSRLSDAARLIAFFMADMRQHEEEDIGREYRAEELAAFLHNCPKAQTVWAHVRQLEVLGYVKCTKEQGGKAHGKWYRWIGLNKIRGNSLPPEKTGDITLPPKKTVGNESYPGNISGVNASSRAGSLSGFKDILQEDDDGDDAAGAREIDPKAEKLIQEEATTLHEAATPLREYLGHRVPSRRQLGYVRTVVQALRGFGVSWQTNDGTPAPVPKRPELLAAALSKLLASDEKDLSRPTGDPDNLWTKLGILLRPWERSHEPNGIRRGGRRDQRSLVGEGSGPARAGPAVGEGRGQHWDDDEG